MKITLLGSTAYQARMQAYTKDMTKKGHEVKIPAFDSFPDLDELGVCRYNLEAIEWADEIHVFWDGRSIGFIFDFGMCFALHKTMKTIYMNKKSFPGLLEKYTTNTPSLLMPECQKQAIAHYFRMIAWVQEQPEDDRPDRDTMYRNIGEDWSSKSCAYCHEYSGRCAHCTLYNPNTVSFNCCSGLWKNLNLAETWREWIADALAVVDYIQKNG